jgi:uncharacterized protein (TIGR02145 family)
MNMMNLNMKDKTILLTLLILLFGHSAFSQANDTFTDPRDGQVYRTITVKISSKKTVTWLAQNLNYMIDGALSYNNDAKNREKYGLLYSYEQAVKACPPGWHIPSQTEWDNLLNVYGGIHKGSDKMLQTLEALKSTSDWDYESKGNGNNSSGFSILPGGFGGGNNVFLATGSYAAFWTSLPGRIFFSYVIGFTLPGLDDKDRFYSVRCIKDN